MNSSSRPTSTRRPNIRTCAYYCNHGVDEGDPFIQVQMLCAVGILSSPENKHRRDAIRSSWLLHAPDSMVAKFVVRARQCNDSISSYAHPERNIAIEQSPDVLLVRSVCQHEPRSRGAVLSIFAWLRHAASVYSSARFIARIDDDVWLDLPSLALYLDVVAQYGASHVLLGRIFYTSWVQDLNHEYDTAFGYTCFEASAKYYGKVEPVTRNSTLNSTSNGPFVFTPGYLTILSQPLAAAVAASAELQKNLQQIQARGGSFGLEDKWLGSAMQRHVGHTAIQYVSLYENHLTSDNFGVSAHSTTILWHNRVKDTLRLALVQNFSNRHGCLSPQSERLAQPTLQCSLPSPMKQTCAPANSTWCTISPLCQPRGFQLNFSGGAWRLGTLRQDGLQIRRAVHALRCPAAVTDGCRRYSRDVTP